MCLAIPGKIEKIEKNSDLDIAGKVNFGGVMKDVNLAYVPEAEIGDYVIVHVGFALNVVDAQEAKKLIQDIEEIQRQEKEEWLKKSGSDEIS